MNRAPRVYSLRAFCYSSTNAVYLQPPHVLGPAVGNRKPAGISNTKNDVMHET